MEIKPDFDVFQRKPGLKKSTAITPDFQVYVCKYVAEGRISYFSFVGLVILHQIWEDWYLQKAGRKSQLLNRVSFRFSA
jgi:hypothetical protein